MAVQRPCYATREEVRRALDAKQAAYNNGQIDRQIGMASDSVDNLCKRKFFPLDTTRFWDWPNWQYAYPWRVWFDDYDLIALANNGLVSGGVVIPNSAVFLRPENSGPPFTWLELDRSKSYSFGNGPTPQREIAITGTWGYWLNQTLVTTLASAVSATPYTSITVADAGHIGVGDTLFIDNERLIVTDRSYVTTGQVQLGTGCSTASPADNQLAVTTASSFATDDTLLLDGEWMRVLVVNTATNVLIVKRAWDGSVLAAHNTATIYADRALTVLTGQLGTTTATHAQNAPVSVLNIPDLVKELALAEALVGLGLEPSGYAGAAGEGRSRGSITMMRSGGQMVEPLPGPGLPDLRERTLQRYGRMARSRVI